MTYKGYTGVLEIEEESGELFGTVLGLRDVITFVGRTVEEARRSFEESVDFYLGRCDATGKSPDRPFAEPLPIRLTPETHRALAILANAHKLTMNDLIARALGDFVAANRLWANPEMEASWSSAGPEPAQDAPTAKPKGKVGKKPSPIGESARR